MRFYLDCIPCIMRYAVSTVRLATDNPEKQGNTIRQVLQELAKIDYENYAPAVMRTIEKIIKQECHCADPYKDMKKQFNQGMLELYPYLEKAVQESPNPFEQAIRYAASANIIDFGIINNLTLELAKKTLAENARMPLRFNTAEELAEDVQKAQKILYLADNSGEIVVDKLLLSRLPREKITFAVKGSPICNDATMEDAEMAGITKLVRVIDTGYALPGTILEFCSPEFQQEFAEADLVIAKGQGNFETLSELKNKKIYFIFKAKCNVVTSYLNCDLNDIILKKSSV